MYTIDKQSIISHLISEDVEQILFEMLSEIEDKHNVCLELSDLSFDAARHICRRIADKLQVI